MLVATAGHVDHGKTLLVRSLTGVDTDRLPEEKERGLTIDLGFAYNQLEEGKTLGFVDVPGHERFVRNMLAGVGVIDCGLLVVAVDDGPMPQTREHFAILDLLGIKQLAVALTKIDKAEEGRVATVRKAVTELLGEGRFADAPIFPVSAMTNDGMEALSEYLDQSALAHREGSAHGNFRLAVDRSFTVSGTGLVVTGAVFSGQITVGDRVLLMPAGIEVRVRTLHAQNQPSREGRMGQRCALNIAGSGLKNIEVHRGDWLVAPSLSETSRRFDARLRVLPSESRALTHWTPVHVHLGAASLTGRVAILEARQIEPGEEGLVQVVLDQETTLVHGDRFVLRDQSARCTIAGGVIIDPLSPARGRARIARIEYLQAMQAEDTHKALGSLLEQELDGVNLEHFALARNLTPAESVACVSQSNARVISGSSARVGISSARWTKIRDRIVNDLRHWHDANQESIGPDDASLCKPLSRQASRALLRVALNELIREGVIVREGSCVRLDSHVPKLSKEEDALWERVRRHVSERSLKPPVVADLAQRLKLDVPSLDAFLGRSVGRGQLVRLARNRCYHPQAIAELARVAELLAKEQENGMFDARSYRDRSGLGRNLAIEVLEYFDATGLTLRVGDARKVIGDGERLFGKPSR